MDSKKQKLLLEYLISSTDTFASCQAIVKPEYFDPKFRNTVKLIKDYYEKYHSVPDPTLIEVETGQDLKLHKITNDQIAYCTSEIEEFCQLRAIENAVLDSVPLIQEGNRLAVLPKIRDALMVSLNKDLGLRYFDNPQKRLERLSKSNSLIPTGWSEVDDLLFGGISRKEMILFAANSGGGKSLTLANLAFSFAEQKLNVLYISLELSESVIAQRFDTMFTGISRRDWKQHISEIAVRVESAKQDRGHLDIKQMQTGINSIQLQAYLKEYYLHYGIMPDLLILDYIDLMYPNEKIDLTDMFTKDKLCSEQLRDIGVQNNMVIATASQLNRSAVNATKHDHSQIAGGISKINTTDVYISIMMNETMRASGEVCFIFQKTRNSDGVGKAVYLKWDAKHLRIIDRETNTQRLTFKKKDGGIDIKKSILGDIPGEDRLLDLMTSNR